MTNIIRIVPIFIAVTPSNLSAETWNAPRGAIEGIAVNGSQSNAPLANATVILRVKDGGRLISLEETVTDAEGHFVFRELPLTMGDSYYLPGVNREGVHFPGPRVHLLPQTTAASVELVAFNSRRTPSPLIADSHELLVRVEHGLLHVTESVVISNPSTYAYVGESKSESNEPVTLRLSLPSGFTKVTFDSEFHGRNFRIVDSRLETTIPWPPGRRQLRFSYLVPNDQTRRKLLRPLDLPCSKVRVMVTGEMQATCNLREATESVDGMVVFESRSTLPVGHDVRVHLTGLPVRFMAYARWIALATLIVAAAFVTAWVAVRTPQFVATADTKRDNLVKHSPKRGKRRGVRRKLKGAA